jgi:hypothetical protein
MQVRVLVANVYNGINHKALPKAQVGDIITVASGAYVQDLIACALVEPYADPAAPTEEQIVAGAEKLLNFLEQGQFTVSPAPEEVKVTVKPLDAQDAQNIAKLDATLKQGFAWDFMEAAGLNNQQAQALYTAGFTSVAVILDRFTAEGLAPFTTIKGIGKKTVERLVGWAAEMEVVDGEYAVRAAREVAA